MTVATLPAADAVATTSSASRVLVHAGSRVRSRWLWLIVGVSFFFNVWGITWGLPQRWHPDELTQRAENMVGDASLNPHYFAYGSLHYYVIAAVAVLPVKVPNKLFHLVSYETQSSMVVTLSRLISACLGTAIVYLTYYIGSGLFTADVGILSAALCACAMVLVSLSHFATTDVPSLFWFMLACAGATAVFRSGTSSTYVAAGVAAGLAAGVKYVGGVALIALGVAHVLRPRRDSHRPLVLATALSFLVFVTVNPTVLWTPLEAVDGFVTESLFNTARGIGLARAFFPLLGQLPLAVGWPLSLLSMAGVLYAVWLLRTPTTRKETVLLCAMLLPYYVVVGSMRGPRAGPWLLPTPPMRYTLPLIPFLLIFGAKLSTDLCTAPSGMVRATARGIVVLVLAYSAAFTLAADLQFVRDSRYAAREWVLANLHPGATVETTSYGPDIPTEMYNVRERPHDNHVEQVALAVTQSPTFLRYQAMRASLGRWLGARAMAAPTTYVPWAAKAEQRYTQELTSFDVSLAGLEQRAPAVFIASDLYTTRFADLPSREGTFFADLTAGRSSYDTVQRLHYTLPDWLDPEPEFVNPTLTIYAPAPR